MASGEDADRLATLLAQSGLNDAFYVKLFGVNQSTVSRLRRKKITKVQRYISAIEATEALKQAPEENFAKVIGQLAKLANERPALRQLLQGVHDLMQEPMQDSGKKSA